MEQSEGSVMIEEFAYVRRVLMREFLDLHHIGNTMVPVSLVIFPKFACDVGMDLQTSESGH